MSGNDVLLISSQSTNKNNEISLWERLSDYLSVSKNLAPEEKQKVIQNFLKLMRVASIQDLKKDMATLKINNIDDYCKEKIFQEAVKNPGKRLFDTTNRDDYSRKLLDMVNKLQKARGQKSFDNIAQVVSEAASCGTNNLSNHFLLKQEKLNKITGKPVSDLPKTSNVPSPAVALFAPVFPDPRSGSILAVPIPQGAKVQTIKADADTDAVSKPVIIPSLPSVDLRAMLSGFSPNFSGFGHMLVASSKQTATNEQTNKENADITAINKPTVTPLQQSADQKAAFNGFYKAVANTLNGLGHLLLSQPMVPEGQTVVTNTGTADVDKPAVVTTPSPSLSDLSSMYRGISQAIKSGWNQLLQYSSNMNIQKVEALQNTAEDSNKVKKEFDEIYSDTKILMARAANPKEIVGIKQEKDETYQINSPFEFNYSNYKNDA